MCWNLSDRDDDFAADVEELLAMTRRLSDSHRARVTGRRWVTVGDQLTSVRADRKQAAVDETCALLDLEMLRSESAGTA